MFFSYFLNLAAAHISTPLARQQFLFPPERDLPIVTTKGINSIHEGTRRFPHAMGIHGDFK